MKVFGIDLAAKETRRTGMCILTNSVRIFSVKTNYEIISNIKSEVPDVVCIDAPLKIVNYPYRMCERILIRMGFRPLPLTMKSMKELALRAVKLKKLFNKMSIDVIETFPRVVETILGIRKEHVEKYLGITINKDEYDAYLCAKVGNLYMKGNAISICNNFFIPKFKSHAFKF